MNKYILFFLAGFAALLIYDSVFLVYEFKQALVFQFGKVVRVIKEPGLHFRIPFVQNVILYDKRILNINAEEKEFTAKDQKRLIVNAFAKYKITDPLKFYQTVTNESGIRSRLDAIIDSSMRQIVGEVPLATFLTDKRPKIMSDIQRSVYEKGKDFGIEVIDVRISRADLPKENSEAIYKRMQTEREREAKQFRAEGIESGQIIRANTDKERTIILADANKQAEILRGDGDAIATKKYAQAYSKDAEFFGFYRSMIAYVNSISKDDTSFILSPDHEFFRYINKIK